MRASKLSSNTGVPLLRRRRDQSQSTTAKQPQLRHHLDRGSPSIASQMPPPQPACVQEQGRSGDLRIDSAGLSSAEFIRRRRQRQAHSECSQFNTRGRLCGVAQSQRQQETRRLTAAAGASPCDFGLLPICKAASWRQSNASRCVLSSIRAAKSRFACWHRAALSCSENPAS